MKVLSVDLASVRYQDLGLARLDVESRHIAFPKPADLGLAGKPEASTLAAALDAYCRRETVPVLLIDGPQAWRYPASPIAHMRLAERVLNTPAKTGDPGQAKPKTALRFVQFSIELFQALRQRHGWSLLTERWYRARKRRFAVETFPSAAWRLLGLPRLPAKARVDQAAIDKQALELSRMTGYRMPRGLTHDELQAAVVLPAGEALARRSREEVILCGFDPIPGAGGLVFEGWIALPRVTAA